MSKHEGAAKAEGTGEDRSRAGLIADAIRQAVVEQRIAPGTRLSEDQIGLMFGASRTIVRGALLALAHDGLVTLAKNKGASVAAPTVEEARHVFDARRALEGFIIARAVERMTGAGARELEALIRRGQKALESGDRGLAIRLSGEFHLAIAAVAAQPVLAGFLSELVSRSSLVIALYARSGTADCGGEEHRAILAALKAGDGKAAAGLMEDHLAHLEADLAQADRSRPAVPLRDALLAEAAPRRAAVSRRSGS